MRFNTPLRKSFITLAFFLIFTGIGVAYTENEKTQAPLTAITQENGDLETPQPTSDSDLGSPLVTTASTAIKETQVNAGQTLKISYINVGQADSALIQLLPQGKTILIDAGNNEDANTIVNYLKDQGVSRLDIVIASHAHEDHIGSLDTIINTFDVSQVVMPKATATTQTFKDVLLAIQNKGLKITEAKAGLKLDLGSVADGELIAPNRSGYEDANNYSAVLRLVYGQKTFLFMGDAEEISESEILSAGYSLKADLVKIGHHGSDSSTSNRFIDAVSPQFAVISVGAGNSYGHPASSTLSKLNARGVQVYRTDEVGTIVGESDGKNITFTTLGHSVEPRAPSSSVSLTPSPSTSSENTAVVPVPAPSGNSDVTVYVTKTGSKYHNDGCSSLSKSKIPMSLNEAKTQYEPCKICKPPQ